MVGRKDIGQISMGKFLKKILSVANGRQNDRPQKGAEQPHACSSDELERRVVKEARRYEDDLRELAKV